MQQETAVALRDALNQMEDANQALRAATDDEVVARAEAYQVARQLAGPVFGAAQREYDLEHAANPASTAEADVAAQEDAQVTAAQEAPGPRRQEAAPGVSLVTPPGMVVTPANLADFGALFWYIPSGGDAEQAIPIQATPYAFDAGTAVETGAGTVATAQPSRIVVGEEGIGVVPQDVFATTYAMCPPDKVPGQLPTPAETTQETPVEGGEEGPPPTAAETPAEAPAAPQTPAEGSTPPTA